MSIAHYLTHTSTLPNPRIISSTYMELEGTLAAVKTEFAREFALNRSGSAFMWTAVMGL